MKWKNLLSVANLMLHFRFKEAMRIILFKLAILQNDYLTYTYSDHFFMHKRHHKTWAKEFAKMVTNLFAPKSVIDFGCGTGDFLLPFASMGVEILGIDGSRSAYRQKVIPKKAFKMRDLRKPVKEDRQFDLCLCFEVAEHMEERYSDILIGSLTSVGARAILFSAAPPGQGGRDHLNLKPKEWWIDKFRKRGYAFEGMLTEQLARGISALQNTEPWYYENLLVFKRQLSTEVQP